MSSGVEKKIEEGKEREEARAQKEGENRDLVAIRGRRSNPTGQSIQIVNLEKEG